MERDLSLAERADALDAMEAAYAAAGVSQFAAWVHESDGAMRRGVVRRGYTLVESTRAMGMALADVRAPRPEIDLGPLEESPCGASYAVMRIATSYFVTELRLPGVSSAGIALSAASPFR